MNTVRTNLTCRDRTALVGLRLHHGQRAASAQSNIALHLTDGTDIALRLGS
jgi:hypothetical protein